MKRKIIGISIVLLLLAVIPSTSIAKEIPIQKEEETGYEADYTGLLGTIIFYGFDNNSIYGFAIRLRYFLLKEAERQWGIITLRNVIVGNQFMLFPIIGKLFFIAGFSTGGLEIPE